MLSVGKNKRAKKELHLVCDWCAQEFKRRTNVSRLIKREIHFCSNSCSGKYKYKHMPQVRTGKNLLDSIARQKTDKAYAAEIANKKKATCLKKYGAETPLASEEIRNLCKQTLIKNHGVDNPLKSGEIKKRVESTNLKRYGNKNQIASKQTRDKSKTTMIERYGVEHQMLLEEIKNKVKTTCLEKYGVDNPGGIEEYIEKAKETNLKKYGAEHYNQTKEYKEACSFRLVKDSKESINEWLRKQDGIKPSITTVLKYFSEQEVTREELENLVKNWHEHKTTLELTAEKLFDSTHFNKKPSGLIENYRPDFKVSDNIYVNVDGLYWHSEQQKSNRYHFKMRKAFEVCNIRLLQFREDEIKNKPDICKSIVSNAIGRCPQKIFARKCIIKKVKQSDATDFLNRNHLMGSMSARHIGLYCNDELITVASYKESNNVCKIERFCSLLDHSVVGGFSKLLAFLEKNCLKPKTTEIHNWVDLRYGTGEHLLNKQFEKREKETLGWKWTDYKKTYNRLSCRANMDERKLTQQKYANELGWCKIYDAGQRLYVKKL